MQTINGHYPSPLLYWAAIALRLITMHIMQQLLTLPRYPLHKRLKHSHCDLDISITLRFGHINL